MKTIFYRVSYYSLGELKCFSRLKDAKNFIEYERKNLIRGARKVNDYEIVKITYEDIEV